MPLKHYGVLKGQVKAFKREGGQSPHFQIQLQAGRVHYRIAVNVESRQHPSELLYLMDERFNHPILRGLQGLGDGFKPLPSRPGGQALDYVRGNLFKRQDMQRLPPDLDGPDNDLQDRLEHFIARAQRDRSARVLAFGERWGPENNKADKIFRFRPGNGIHDIHMNQGNSKQFKKDDGVWQDGGLLIHFPARGQWVGIFLAFQSQSWHTDDRTGHALPGRVAEVKRRIQPGRAPKRPTQPGAVRIIAALVNPKGANKESIALLNATTQTINLRGWQLLDQRAQTQPLSGSLGPGQAKPILLKAPFELARRGGLISLINPEGLKVDGVAYGANQVREGMWVVF